MLNLRHQTTRRTANIKNSHNSTQSLRKQKIGTTFIKNLHLPHQLYLPQHSGPLTMHNHTNIHSRYGVEEENIHGENTERIAIDDIHPQRLPLVIMDGSNICVRSTKGTYFYTN